jgi:hypothetical protein
MEAQPNLANGSGASAPVVRTLGMTKRFRRTLAVDSVDL